jgi:hypothetical protein
MTITTFIGVVYLICVTKLEDPLFGRGAVAPLTVVLCKLSQLNLFETTGINGTKLFLEY